MNRTWLVIVGMGCARSGDDPTPPAATETGGPPVVVETGGATGDSSIAVDEFSAEEGVWSYVPVDGMECGNGDPTGIGVNPGADPTEIVFLVQGAGSCWDYDSCVRDRLAPHLQSGWGPAELAIEAQPVDAASFFDRTDPANPFNDSTWIMIPYCTGDLHVGRTIREYDPKDPTHRIHHSGDANFAAAVGRTRAAIPGAEQVWVIGVGGGGYGAQLQGDRFGGAWPGADLAILADSAPMAVMSPGRLELVSLAWEPRLPPRATTFDSLTDLLAVQVLNLPTTRFGLLESWQDATTSAFLDLGDLDSPLNALLYGAYQGDDLLQAFVVGGTNHLQIEDPSVVGPTGVTLAQWVGQWRDADADWSDAFD